MLKNLKAEMARNDVSGVEISRTIGRSQKSVSEKICGRTQFTISEAMLIKNKFFPNSDMEYLFSDEAG